MKLSIVVPCYNEAKNIPFILERFAKVAAAQPSVEVILVNNGSADDSTAVLATILQQSQYHFARVVMIAKNIGYGHGIMTGLRAARGEVLAWTHADMQTDPLDVVKAYQCLQQQPTDQPTLVKGRRLRRPLSAWAFTLGMSGIASVVLKKVLTDINAQPKVFDRRLFNLMIQAPDDFSLDLYLLYLAKQHQYTIATVPVLFTKRLYGESKWAFSWSSRYRTIMRTLKYIFALHRLIKQ